jgi:SAM-dependent methyltransferase
MDPEEYARQLRKPEGDDALETTNRMAKLNKGIYAHAASVLPLIGHVRLLEIGPGNGSHARAWLEGNPDLHYSVLDYSRDVLDILQRNLAPWHSQLETNCGDARECTLYKKESTDAILSVNTLYFMDDLNSLFSLWLYALKPGGKLVLGFRPAAVMRQFPFSAHGFRLYDESEVRNALLSAGFHKVDEHLSEDEPREVEGRLVPVSGCCWVYQR